MEFQEALGIAKVQNSSKPVQLLLSATFVIPHSSGRCFPWVWKRRSQTVV